MVYGLSLRIARAWMSSPSGRGACRSTINTSSLQTWLRWTRPSYDVDQSSRYSRWVTRRCMNSEIDLAADEHQRIASRQLFQHPDGILESNIRSFLRLIAVSEASVSRGVQLRHNEADYRGVAKSGPVFGDDVFLPAESYLQRALIVWIASEFRQSYLQLFYDELSSQCRKNSGSHIGKHMLYSLQYRGAAELSTQNGFKRLLPSPYLLAEYCAEIVAAPSCFPLLLSVYIPPWLNFLEFWKPRVITPRAFIVHGLSSGTFHHL